MRRDGRPHAVAVGDAGSLSRVLGDAGKTADGLRRIGVDAGDGVDLAVEAAVEDGTTEITASSAVGEGAVLTLEAALEVDPFA